MGNVIHHGVLPATRAIAGVAACFLAVAVVFLVLAKLGIVGIEFFQLAFAAAILIPLFLVAPGGIMEREISAQRPSPKPTSLQGVSPQTDFKERRSPPDAPPPRIPPAI